MFTTNKISLRRNLEAKVLNLDAGCVNVYMCAFGEVAKRAFRRWNDIWLCLSWAKTQPDFISPVPGQLM